MPQKRGMYRSTMREDDEVTPGQEDRDFPASARDRGMAAARTGLKMGGNYARYLARRAKGEERTSARGTLHADNAEDMFSELVRLRGTALKMAQGLSMEPGLLPEQFSRIMAQAQYEVPPMGPALVRRTVEQGLGRSPEEAFAAFGPHAVAAASLGQVHEGRLHDGRRVAIKVQYPNVRESIDADLRMVRTIAGRFIDVVTLDPYLEEVRDRMMEETDYRAECAQLSFFARQYGDVPGIVTPNCIPELTSERVLTMTWVDGLHLRAFLATDPDQDTKNAFGQLLWDFVHEQIAADHLTVHADAHPGNFLFREDGTLGVLDFGCVKTFPRAFRDDLIALYRARMAADEAGMLAAYERLDILGPGLDNDARSFLLDILEKLGQVIETLYRHDTYDFGEGQLLARFQAVMPELTGREAWKNRQPVGSRHFVFVNRLLAGLLSMLTGLGAVVDTRHARQCLEQA